MLQRKPLLKNVVVSLSLANLCFLKVWSELLVPRYDSYRIAAIEYVAAVICVIILALVFWTLALLAKKIRHPAGLVFGRLVFLGILALVVWSSHHVIWPDRFMLNIFMQAGKGWLVVFVLLLTSLCIYAFIRYQQFVMRTATGLVCIFLPFVIITFGQSGWRYANFNSATVSTAVTSSQIHIPASNKIQKNKKRILILLFDEMDQHLAFSERPETVKLPELDRFRKEAISADNAFPPADHTMQSIPAVFIGKLVAASELDTSGKMMIKTHGSKERVNITNLDTIFSTARELGFQSAVLGDILPYNEILKKHVNYILPTIQDKSKRYTNIIKAIREQFQTTLCYMIPYAVRLNLPERLKTVEDRKLDIDFYLSNLNHAKELAENSQIDLIFMHSALPHTPFIYDRFKDEFSTNGKSTYLDNLELADRTFGELRSTMEKEGTWDSTVVLVTSDHWWRNSIVYIGKSDHRVPFILKLPGQKKQVVFDHPFNTILIHDLVIALLKGELSKPDDVTEWLDKHKTFGESPLTRSFP